MEFSLGLQMDEETAKRVVSTQNNNTTTSFQGYSYNGKNLSFLTAKGHRMNKNDLKYNNEYDLENMNFELTDVEEKVHKLLKLEHNTIDVINENIKLKEMCKYLKSIYEHDVDKIRQDGESTKSKVADLEAKLEQAGKDLEYRNGENNDLLLTQQKRQKEFDELYALLEEREKEVESANKYSESLLAEKKKLIGIIEQKDRKIENLAKDLYHKDQQLGQQLDDLNKIIRELQDEKRALVEGLKHKGDQLADVSKKNGELKKELDAVNADYKKHFDANTRAANGNKEDDLILKQRELDNLLDEHDNLKAAFDRLAKDYDDLKVESVEKEKNSANPVRDEKVERELQSKNNAIDDSNKEIQKLKAQLDDKNDKISELESTVDGLKKALKRAEEDNSDQAKKIGDLNDKLHKSEEDNKALDLKNKDIHKQMDVKDKQIDLLKDENEKQKNLLKDQIEEIEKINDDLQNANKQKKAAEDEIEKLKNENTELLDENIDLKANKGGFNTNVANHLDDMKQVLAQKDNKVNNAEYEIKKLNDTNNDLAAENGKLKKQSDDLKRKIKELEDSIENKDKDLQDLKDENNNISTDLDETIKENADLQNKINKLEDSLKALKSDDKAKQKLAEIETLNNAEYYKILKSVLRLKIKAADAIDVLIDGDTVDATQEEADIQKLTEDQYKENIHRLINETDSILEETKDEAESAKRSLRNLINEKALLTEKMQELMEKYADIRIRHDNKTDQIGKLSVKTFILSLELNRVDNKK